MPSAMISGNVAGWRETSIRAICEPTQVWNPQRDPRDEFWYVDVSAVSRGSLAVRQPQRVKAADAPSRARKIIKSGDTIFATVRPTLRRIAFIDAKFHDQIASTAFCIVRPNNEEAVPRFLYYALQTDSINEEIARFESGASYPAVNDKDILDRSIFLPPKREQEKIAAVLWKVQRAIEVEAKLTATARELKQVATRQLFTSGTDGRRGQETDVGMFPTTWDSASLGELAAIEYGAQAAVASATDPSIGTPIFTNINISNDGNIDLTKLRYFAVPERYRDRLILRKGDVLFNWRSGSADHVGKTALFSLDGEYTYSSFILRFRVRNRISAEFLHRYLNYIKAEGFFSNRRNVSSINSVFNASLAATIPVYFPPTTNEQVSVVKVLDAVDAKISLHERKLAALQELFRTLLNKLMTGAIRIADLEIDTSEVAA